jgi:hypothetical protein
MRPPSHGQMQGVRSGAVSAAGRTPLDRINANGQGSAYHGGGMKSVGRPLYGRR